MTPDVSIVACSNYESAVCREALTAVLAPLGGLDWVTPGMKIAIKTNLVTGMKPEQAATTHPQLLCQLTAMLRERGAEVVIGDSPGGLYNAAALNSIYKASGLDAVEAFGATLNRDFSQATAHFPEAAVGKEFQYTRYLDDADAIIDFCKLKTHGMMGMTAAAKNLFGTIPGTLKPEYHYKYRNPRDFARLLVDIYEYFKPRLVIVDAVVGMEGNGPTAGTPREIGALLAGTNAHKVDLACAAVIGLGLEDVPTLDVAYERELIPASWKELEIAGNLQDFFVPDFKNVIGKSSHLFDGRKPGLIAKIRRMFMSACFASRPQVKKSACIGCRKCAEVCPAKAITMKNKLPVIDRKACICCFCCQEFCPKGAMIVHRTPIAKLLNRRA